MVRPFSTGRFGRTPGKARRPDGGAASGALATRHRRPDDESRRDEWVRPFSTGRSRRTPGKARRADGGAASGALATRHRRPDDESRRDDGFDRFRPDVPDAHRAKPGVLTAAPQAGP